MKFQALDLNQDGSVDRGEALFFCESHGIDPAQCGDIFTFCDTDVDDLLALPEGLHCEPPEEYSEVSQNYDEQKYDGSAATDPELAMDTYTALLAWKPPALRGARKAGSPAAQPLHTPATRVLSSVKKSVAKPAKQATKVTKVPEASAGEAFAGLL